MRAYEVNSPQAAGRVLALTMLVDGNLAQSELAAMDRSKILNEVELERDAFQQLLQQLCEDLLTCSVNGVVHADVRMIDAVLLEIDDPALRRHLLKAMWKIADADGGLADREALLLSRAGQLWGAERSFLTDGAARA